MQDKKIQRHRGAGINRHGTSLIEGINPPPPPHTKKYINITSFLFFKFCLFVEKIWTNVKYDLKI